MKELLILTSGYPRWPGDATTPFVKQFAEQMATSVDEVTVLAPHFAGAKVAEREGPHLTVRRFRYFLPYRHEDVAYGGNAVARVKGTPLYLLKLLLYVASAFVRVVAARPVLVNAHWLIPQGLVAVAAKPFTRARVVVTVHGGDVFSLNGTLMRRIKRAVLRSADAVVVNSSATRKACEELCPERSYEVIPMGIDTDTFKPAGPSAAGDRVQQRDFTVLFVGRLTEDKGVIDLLQALELLQASGARFRAIVVGSGNQEEELRRFVEQRDLRSCVEFTGWVGSEDLVAYYHAADVFVGPSIVGSTGWKEALGLVFVEALATGLPVIATDTGGIADVVEDGVTGYLVDQQSPHQLFEKLRLLYEDRPLLARLSRQGRATVEQRFSWATVGSRYEELFAAVLK